jgi:hypothetical protein
MPSHSVKHHYLGTFSHVFGERRKKISFNFDTNNCCTDICTYLSIYMYISISIAYCTVKVTIVCFVHENLYIVYEVEEKPERCRMM